MYVETVDMLASDAKKALAHSLATTGFVVLKNHPLSLPLMYDVMEDWKRFFANEKKHEYNYKDEKWGQYQYLHGYYPYRSESAKSIDQPNLLECFHYYEACGIPEEVHPRTTKLFAELQSMSAMLLGWLEEETPEEIRSTFTTPLPEMVAKIPGKTHGLMRFFHYPPVGKENLGRDRNIAHEDAGLLTVLPVASAPGLQVQDMRGNWHDVICEPEAVVLNSADMLQHITNGHYKSTTHRVVTLNEYADKPRYSFTYFEDAIRDVEISRGLTSEQFLMNRFVENEFAEAA